MNGRSMEGDRESIGYRDGRAEVWVFERAKVMERDASLERGCGWGWGDGGGGGDDRGIHDDGGVGGVVVGRKGKGERGWDGGFPNRGGLGGSPVGGVSDIKDGKSIQRGMGGLLELFGRVNLFSRFLFALDDLEIGYRGCGHGRHQRFGCR